MTAPNMSFRCFTEVSPLSFPHPSSMIHQHSPKASLACAPLRPLSLVSWLQMSSFYVRHIQGLTLYLGRAACDMAIERWGVGGLCFAHVLTTVSDLPLASSYLRCLFTTPSLVFGMRPFRHPDRPIRSGNSFSGIILSE